MMLEQGFFFLSLPIFLRFRSLDFSFPQWIGLLQDLFIVLELLLFLPLSPFLTAALGLSLHLYLILDAFLFKKMHLRMRILDLHHLRHPKSLWDSAKELGLRRFLAMGCGVLAVHALMLLRLPGSYSKEYLLLFAGVSALAFLGSARLTKTAAFAYNNPLFQDHLDFFRRLLKKTLLNNESFFRPASFSGPKTFEINASDKPHLIFLFLESFSAKNVRASATPCFDRLTKEGIFFSQFYANGTLTYRAMLASLFGLPPGSTAAGLRPYVDFPFAGLPEILKNQGYRSAFHHNGSLSYDKQREFLEKHFEEILDRGDLERGHSLGWGCDDERLMRYSANWLEEQKTPAFLTLFTISNHHPWILPSNVPSHYRAPSVGFLPASKERFLRTTHYTDFCLGLFLDLLREKNLSQKTILFILGDHGQPMGEHQGNFYNSRFIYEENVRVPLLILADGRIANPTVIDRPASQVDLLPTAMDLFNLRGSIPPCGASLMRSHPERTLFLQNPYSEGFFGCRKGDWKWIENSLSTDGELYDLGRDPEEMNNLATVHAPVADSLRSETRQFFAALDDVYKIFRRKSPTNPTPSLLELDFSDQLISDEDLIEQVPESLRRIRLENCLLLTDRGIALLFKKCPFLETVHLKGNDLTDAMFENGAPASLQLLDISGAIQISDRGLATLAKCCPQLAEFAVSGRNLTDRGLDAIGPHLTRLKLFEGPQITDDGFVKFLQKSKNLNRLVLHGCPKLTDRILVALEKQPLEQLWIYGSPLITGTGADKLLLRSFILENGDAAH